MLLARTTIATGPVSGATSTATTGTFAAAAVLSTVPAADVSNGEKMMPLAPSEIEFLTPVICLAVSNSELNGCKRSTPWALASATMYLLYEVQNGEVSVVRSTATFGASAAPAALAIETADATSAPLMAVCKFSIFDFLPVRFLSPASVNDLFQGDGDGAHEGAGKSSGRREKLAVVG